MQALVTGCAGFIGSHLTDTLLAEGHRVRGVDAFTHYYDPETKRANLARALTHPRFEMVEADLRHESMTDLLDGIDLAFHLAGQPGVRASWGESFATYVEHNVLATQRLLEAVRTHPIDRLVFASSSSVYGNAPQYPTTEDDVPHPHSPYGVTKLAAEHLCGLYAANHGIHTVSLRYFTVYGPRQRPDMAFARFLDAALAGRPIVRYGDGEQTREYTYVSDIVAATVAASSAAVSPGSVLNVGGGSEMTVNAILALMGELLGRDPEVEQRPDRPGDVRRTGGSAARAHTELGWTPEVDLRAGIAAQLEWFTSTQ